MADPEPTTPEPDVPTDQPETTSIRNEDADSTLSSTSNKSSYTLLADKFAAACERTPCPTFSPAQLPSATKEELQFLTQNSAGEILVSSESVHNCTLENRDVMTNAIQKVLQHVASPHGSFSNNQKRKTHRQSSQLSFAELLKDDRISVSPMSSLSSFTWDNSKSAAVLEEATREIQTKTASKGIDGNESALLSMSTNMLPHLPNDSAANIRTNDSILDSDPPTLDLVVLAAQEEAVASAVLKEVRTNHARLRKSSSSFSNGQTPVWALLAQRGGKLKPEAAAEMARARVAAATAAAVMRDAFEAESKDQSHSSPTESHGRQRCLNAPSSLPGLDDISDYADHDHDFLHEYQSPRYRPPFQTSSSKSRLSNLNHPPRPLSVSDTTPRSKALEKKRVSFVEGTIFHTKK